MQRIEVLATRLRRTNEHIRGVADILEHYVQGCKDAGMHGTAKALQQAVGQLYVTARLNDRVITDTQPQPQEPAA